MSTASETAKVAPDVCIPLCVPEIRGNAWAYVKECLDSGWVSSVGAYVNRFERELAAKVGAGYAVATVNGTAALHTALLVAGIERDDEVLVPSLTFIASANAVRYVGAWPVFIDAEPVHWQMDVAHVAEFLQQECVWVQGELRNRTTGRRVRAILPVHLLGHPVDMDPLLALARQYGLIVIEDATESLGALYRGRPVGTLGDIACFSFNGNKLITTGGGGMIVTDNAAWAERARHLTTQAKIDPVEYIHDEVGYNYRLTNLQAALGCAQLESLEEYIATKRRIAAVYSEALRRIPGLRPMPEAAWAFSACWMFTTLVEEEAFGMDSRALLRSLHEWGIQTRPLWQPLHRSPAYADCPPFRCDVADSLYARALSLPCSVGLTSRDQQYVIERLAEAAAYTGR